MSSVQNNQSTRLKDRCKERALHCDAVFLQRSALALSGFALSGFAIAAKTKSQSKIEDLQTTRTSSQRIDNRRFRSHSRSQG